ncbi:unnamed protein product [Clonostachys byssicola]|uniref:Uncharacterized protein n=1 Tax=Clonostachys byssicola TaxID=160290 RepID=A0A9N9U8G5_9HYPO|nr:unnamed protein product [Clonostachys byssicola]
MAEFWTEEVIADQKRDLPILATKENTAGGTYIVTGANSGLGLEAAKHYVALGAAKVILAVRNLVSGEKAKAEIEAATSTSGIAEVWHLDLSSYDSVKAFASKVTEKLERIDAVIENAGVALDKFVLAEGHESSVTINVYSTFLLGILLLPKLRESAAKFGTLPHLVIVSSGGAVRAKPVFMSLKDDLFTKMDDEKNGMMGRYPLTKLIEIYAGRYLATLAPVERTGVVINYLDPGLCYTNLTSNVDPKLADVIENERNTYFGRTPEMGSRTLIAAAVQGKESHGRLSGSCLIQDHRVPDYIKDSEGQVEQKKIWEAIAAELNRVAPGCVDKALA